MSFQAYLDAIATRTDKSASEFCTVAAERVFADAGGLSNGVKAGVGFDGLTAKFDRSRAHAMAIVALLKGLMKEGDA